MVSESALVDDIVQETFIRVWRYLPTFRGEGSFEGWIIRICHNVIRTTMKRRKFTEPIETDIESPVDEYGSFDMLNLVSTLSPDHRAVTVLCLVLGHSYEDAAHILEIPIGTVRSRVSRARAALQEKLAAEPTRRTDAG
jgi:RNA polymerase sigma-70 factor (ECF subfamily)